MLYIIADENDHTAWYPNYLSEFKRGIESLHIEHIFTPSLPENSLNSHNPAAAGKPQLDYGKDVRKIVHFLI